MSDLRQAIAWGTAGVVGLALLVGLYLLTATAPHCGQWQTLRQVVESYDEYVWNPLAQKMVPQHHPEQTYLSFSYCSEPLR